LVPANRLVDVARRKLVQLLVVAKDDDGNVDGAQHRELMRLLEQAAFALQERPGLVSVGSRLLRLHDYTTTRLHDYTTTRHAPAD